MNIWNVFPVVRGPLRRFWSVAGSRFEAEDYV